ncbi:MAG: MBL fold metallo-hydrolase [Longimicrobiales bacterium]|nr:MBL fold metallo-hydrolase [Longimicrobiales bacterium]
MTDSIDGITWFRGSSVRIRRDDLEIHVDPLGVDEDSEADFVLLTHPHYDNFSEDDIARVRGARTVLIAPASMKKQLDDADHFMRPGDMLQLEGFDVLAVPAHNVAKKFHTPDQGWLGYVFTVGGTTYYHAGDTDFLDAMYGIRCDVAFLPVGGHYTMGVDDAAKAGEACGAEVVVPIHWGDPHGTEDDIRRLEELFSRKVKVLEPHALRTSSAPDGEEPD